MIPYNPNRLGFERNRITETRGTYEGDYYGWSFATPKQCEDISMGFFKAMSALGMKGGRWASGRGTTGMGTEGVDINVVDDEVSERGMRRHQRNQPCNYRDVGVPMRVGRRWL
jgi:hypothetical protein